MIWLLLTVYLLMQHKHVVAFCVSSWEAPLQLDLLICWYEINRSIIRQENKNALLAEYPLDGNSV